MEEEEDEEMMKILANPKEALINEDEEDEEVMRILVEIKKVKEDEEKDEEFKEEEEVCIGIFFHV